MKVHWIVEKDYQDKLVEAIKKDENSSGCSLLEYRPFVALDPKEYMPDVWKGPCISHTSLNANKFLCKHPEGCPMVYSNHDFLSCLYYYPRLHEFLLNRDYMILTHQQVIDGWIDKKDGEYSPNWFIRPVGGFKEFTGKVIGSTEEYKKLISYYGDDLKPDSLVLVAPPQNIWKEFRVSVIDNVVSSISQYRPTIANYDNIENGIREYANEVINTIKTFEFDKAYILDIAVTDDWSIKLIEINSWSCAGMYELDLNRVVRDMNILCLKEWNELYG
jgi:hypothetical protein